MNYKTRAYPQFSACGLNCGLCPRYHTAGPSRCPGCAGEGFSEVHPPCGILSCCLRRGIEYCFECGEYPCKKYDGADTSDSFTTHKNQFRDMDRAGQMGMEAYAAGLNEKMELLNLLLERYDDGRRKGFYCLAVNLLELPDIKGVMERLDGAVGGASDIKDRAKAAVRLFNETAEQKGVSLKLRK